jgi:hypothetical protein
MTRACLIIAAVLLAAGSSSANARGGGQGHALGVEPSASTSVETRSNKGGAVRGLTRADAVAGVHGDKGRDRAELNKKK